MSAVPSATWQNLIAEPLALRVSGPSEARNASVAASRCERLTAATAPASGQRRVWIACGIVGAVCQQPQPFGLLADNTAPNLAAFRRRNDAGDRHAARDNRQIDREFVAAGNKLARAVERIDNQETLVEARDWPVGGQFFGNDRDAWQQSRQTLQDCRFG